jgi:hypothetical protein
MAGIGRNLVLVELNSGGNLPVISVQTCHLTATLSSWRREHATKEEKHEADQENLATTTEQRSHEYPDYC